MYSTSAATVAAPYRYARGAHLEAFPTGPLGPRVLLPTAQLGYQFHFYGGVERQLGDAHGRAGVEPRLSEDLTQEIRGPVEHLRLAVEPRRGGDVTGDLHDAAYVVQPTGLCRSGG